MAERLGHELEQALAGGLSRGHTIRDKIFRSQTIFYDYVRDNRALYQIFREAEFVRLDLPVQTYHRLARQLKQHLFPVDDSSIAVDDIARSAVPFAILGSAYMLLFVSIYSANVLPALHFTRPNFGSNNEGRVSAMDARPTVSSCHYNERERSHRSDVT